MTLYSPIANVMAYFVGTCMHLLHFCLRSHQMYTVPECNCTWEDFSADEIREAWISLVSSSKSPFTCIIWFDHVSKDLGSVILIILSLIHGYFISTTYRLSGQNRTIWLPYEFVLTLFCVYSPAHALLWMATTWANWMLMAMVMILLSKQVCF